MNRHIIGALLCLGFITLVCVGFYILSQNWEPLLIMENDWVIPMPDVTIETWLEPFTMWSMYIVIAAWVAAVSWFVIGKWFFPVTHWRSAGKRTIWILLSIIPLAVIAVAYFFTPVAQEGNLIAWAFYLGNGILPYYLATALFSPPAYKYSPVGAMTVWRRIW